MEGDVKLAGAVGLCSVAGMQTASNLTSHPSTMEMRAPRSS
jgi:hypothetical protein